MKKILFLLIFNSHPIAIGFLSLNSFSQSPDFLWAKSMGGTSWDEGYSIVIDPSGSGAVYTTGRFGGTADFDPGAGIFNLTSAGLNDIFISKSDSLGNFIWAIAMGGTGWDEGYSIAIDPAGSGALYTTGLFDGTVDFDPGSGVFNLTSAGGYDIFISKLDSSGNFVWAKAIGGASDDYGNSIAIDPAGSGAVYTTGWFQGTADFDPDTSVGNVFNLTSAGSYDIVVSKLNSSGNFVWAKRIGGIDNDYGNSIAIDTAGSGDVYTTGYFHGTADFDPDTSVGNVFNLTSAFGYEIFISKLDSSGNFVWAKKISTTIGWTVGFSIAIDPAGSGAVYTTGEFEGTADFDPGAGIFNLTSAGINDIFISKLDSSGNFVWAKAMGGTGWDIGFSIAIDHAGSGDVYTTGRFGGTADFDPDTSVGNVFPFTSAGGYDIFISKLDDSGNFVWAKAMGGTDDDVGYSIAIGASGNVHVIGWFRSPSISFGPITLNNSGITDIFIAKLDTTVVTGINALENFNSGVSIYPNPFSNSTIIYFSLSQPQNVSLKIFDVNGRLVTTVADKIFPAGENEIVWNAADANAGVYFLQLQSTSYSENRKLIVTKK